MYCCVMYLCIYVSLGRRKKKMDVDSLSYEHTLYKLSQNYAQAMFKDWGKAVEEASQAQCSCRAWLGVFVFLMLPGFFSFCGSFFLA